MDDVGLNLARTREGGTARLGTGLVHAMPVVLSVLSYVGIAAMLWVGGHILLVGLDELGVHFLYDFVHHLEEDLHGGVLGWLVNTAASAVLGLMVGAVVVAVTHGRKKH
jgi:predicted DNA repair protein MutK